MFLNFGNMVPCKLFTPSDKIPNFGIGNTMREALCFREDLIITLKDDSTSDAKSVGGYSISTESIGRENKEFMIQVLSSLNLNDTFAGCKIISSTTAEFHCLDEKRTEFVSRVDGLQQKMLLLGLEGDIYHLQTEYLCPCHETHITKKDLPICCYGELMTEGANLLLMRYLALKNFQGNLSFQSIMIEGQLTTNNYRCTEARPVEFNDRVIEAYTIERRMHEECGLVHNTKTHMTRKGKILSHDWLEVPYLLRINPLLCPNDLNSTELKIQVPLRSRWRNDIQMLSAYLDQKTLKMAQQTEYLIDHPEIKQLISDYTQTLLAVKPINVLSFTTQHFAAFAANPEYSRIYTSGETNLDIISKLAKQTARKICSVCKFCSDCITSELSLLDSENDLRVPNTHCPPPESGIRCLSLCSVFSKCPSNSTCVEKLSRDGIKTAARSGYCEARRIEDKKYSRCSFHRGCRSFCAGCQSRSENKFGICEFPLKCEQTSDGEKKLSSCHSSSSCTKTCDGCKAHAKKNLSVCSISSNCKQNCNGCKAHKKKNLSVCSISSNCKQNCNGCKAHKKKNLSVCSISSNCKQNCNGCKAHKKKNLSVCSISSNCKKNCAGCKAHEKKNLSVCSISSNCKNNCDGCEAYEKKNLSVCSISSNCKKNCHGCRPVMEPCPIQTGCPECLGCQLPDVQSTKNYRGNRVEIFPK